jgi:hypothetical protein
VFVTGASGKTGALVVQQLLKLSSEFEVAVAVRSDKVKLFTSTSSGCFVLCIAQSCAEKDRNSAACPRTSCMCAFLGPRSLSEAQAPQPMPLILLYQAHNYMLQLIFTHTEAQAHMLLFFYSCSIRRTTICLS